LSPPPGSASARRPAIVGFDVGSTTVKAVVVDPESRAILWQDYQRHETRQPEKVLEFLRRMEQETGIDDACRIFFTGSGGGRLAPLVGGRFVQEVLAVLLAVERLHPETRSIIELGGQDAKIVVLKEDPGSRRKRKVASMNDKCAGGTGAVIDRMAAKLRIPPADLGRLHYDAADVQPIAGKCGVFAETDINSLHKRGVPPSQLMASLFEAIVVQNLTVLTRGHTLQPIVLLLGGPNTFLPGLREAWQARIPPLWEERGVELPPGRRPEDLIYAPVNSLYFAAIGAVEFGCGEDGDVGRYRGTSDLEAYLEAGRLEEKLQSGARSLSESGQDLEGFLARYRRADPGPARFGTAETVRAFVGIDGGSTSTKAVLLSEDGAILAKAYQLSRGHPIHDTVDVLESLHRQVTGQGARLEVLGAATTGYAKDLLKDVFKADAAVVETVAHAQAAVEYYGTPDVIVDVGGQDIKLILLKDGKVRDFMLNTQCSAGNGYFLQSTAQDFDVGVERYADLAFSARVMPIFTYGCAVFLQSDIVSFMRQGWCREEILAGLAAVLPRNIWLYVAKTPRLPLLGRRFVLQGGTQRNLAAVKAQVDYIRARFEGSGVEPEVLVHEHCGEAGAIGAALEARRLWSRGRKTTLVPLDGVGGITFRTTRGEETRCRFCQNRCLRTFIDVRLDGREREERLIVSTCEKGSVEDVEAMRDIKAGLVAVMGSNPNLSERLSRQVWESRKPPRVADPIPDFAWSRAGRRRIAAMRRREGLRIGIPRVLNLYQYYPVFSAYFESLGVPSDHLVLSDYTSDRLYREGACRGAIDPCFPAKVATSHVHDLIYHKHRRQPLDCIFFPMIDVLTTPLVKTLADNACPMVCITPEVVKAAFTKESDVFREHGIQYVSPLVNLSDRKLLARQMFRAWQPILGLAEEENDRATEAGLRAYAAFQSEARAAARGVIDMLEREDRLGIVILGRAYHHDPGINHGIFEDLQKLGYPILSQATLPVDEDLLERLFGEEVAAGTIESPLDISDVWKTSTSAASSQKIWAAKFAARHPNLAAVEISSFKCGHDAPIYSVVEQVVETAGTPFFAFRDIDENTPVASFKVRVETIHHLLARHLEDLRGRRMEVEKKLADHERRLRQDLRAVPLR
jgi:predicted CoA-substrate-specific enzyme activase